MLVKLAVQRLWLVLCFFLTATVALAQQRTVSGKVTDQNNQPASGATITVRGTNVATQADAGGNFSISVPANSNVLTVTSVGFESRDIDVTNQTTINISLGNSASNLNEVVVTGYTSQRKKDITGAVTVVNVADLKSQPAADATSQLQGRASGVTVVQSGVPGAAASVRIRGLGSFNNNNPLYVIDGVQTGSISGLNPNDIESMQVLKDAASASIYGVRGSNGVVVITTRKGRRGGVNVAYDMYYGIQDPGKGLEMLNAQEAAELTFLAQRNSGLPTTGSVYGSGTTPVLPDYIYYSGASNNGVPIMAGNPGVDPSKYQLDYNRLGDNYSPYIIVPANKAGTDWYKEVTRKAPIQSHNLTLSGANEASRFLLSLNFFDQDAITKYQFYKRYTARLNSEFTFLKSVRVGQNLQVFSSESNVPPSTGGLFNNSEASIIAQTFRPSSIVPVYTINNGDFAGNLGGNGFGTWGNAKNPLGDLYRRRNDRNNSVSLFGNVYAEVDIVKHLTARTSFGGSINTGNAFTYPFIEYENTENTGNTTYTENFIRTNNWIWTNQLTYRNVFDKHSITLLAGEEAQKGGGRQIIGAASAFFNYNNLPFINLNNGGVQNLGGSSMYTPGSTLSYFAKADYAFNGKYLVSATIRRDGSSKFLNENRWGTFPAFSLGWRLSDESFMRNISWITDLKLRGSWGKQGNEAALGNNNAFTTFSSNRGSSFYDLFGTQNAPQEGFFLSFSGNQLGKWETGITSNVGFDATLFNGSTDVIFDWYQKKTEDLLYNPTVQAIAGSAASRAFRNVGGMENNGVDLMITNRSKFGAVKFNNSITFTTYKNKIAAINGEDKFFDFNSPANEANRIGQNATRNFVGSPLNTFYGYKVIGLFQSAADVAASPKQPLSATDPTNTAAPGRFKYADISGPDGKPDGIIDANDRTIIGNPNPDFTYGINLGAEYQAFDVSMFFYGVQGKDAFNFTRWWTDFSPGDFPGGRSKRALYESWLPDGSRPNAKTPIQEATGSSANVSTSKAVNSYYVEDASYFRLRNLQIGYTLSSGILSKVHISKARIYVQGTNLFTITKYTGLNPDVISTDDRAASVDVGAYPTVKQFLIGANINF